MARKKNFFFEGKIFLDTLRFEDIFKKRNDTKKEFFDKRNFYTQHTHFDKGAYVHTNKNFIKKTFLKPAKTEFF